MRKWAALLLAAALLATAAPIAASAEAENPYNLVYAEDQTLRLLYSTEATSLCSFTASGSANDWQAVSNCVAGLVTVDEYGKKVPALAESWDVSEDQTVYTFHLRDAEWSDGQAVTATDFAETWKRMLTRQDAMDLAYLIFPIKNAAAVNTGEMDASELGVKVIDEKTLEVTLEAAYPFMVALFASSPMYPIRSDLVEEYGDAYGSAADKMACNGPYILKEWAHGDRLVFEKNPGYWNAENVKIEEVTLLYVSDANTFKNMYDTGEIYWMDLASDMVASYADTPEFQRYTAGGVQFIVLSQKGVSEEAAKITSNRNFLMALSSAIDRQALVDAMFPTAVPFTGVINPGISDELGGLWGDTYDVTDVYHKVNGDAEAAKEYIAKACEELGYASAADMPALDYFTTTGDTQRTLAEYFQNIWLETLGVKIEIRQLEGAQYWENLYSQPYDICRTGWGPDYDDPFTYLDMWDSRGGWNKTGWVGEEYYELITEANKQADFKTRNDMFFEAEKILLTEAPIIPLYRTMGALVLSSKIRNVSINTFGARFDFRYAYFE